ncbi:MAG: hypothetical protein Q4C98_06380 [Capnocytophaga sp.]|nr:hypothetical protein [Capnocytophaga sp.]
MTTENVTPRLNNLSNINPIMIYDGIMEMIFQEESKATEKTAESGVLVMVKKVYQAVKAFFTK